MSELNLGHDDARALHRIVRAMHDGECPKCHGIFPSSEMQQTDQSVVLSSGDGWTVFAKHWVCPNCSFRITQQEADAVFSIFAPFMERNLAIFEKWRAERKEQE